MNWSELKEKGYDYTYEPTGDGQGFHVYINYKGKNIHITFSKDEDEILELVIEKANEDFEFKYWNDLDGVSKAYTDWKIDDDERV